MHSAYNSSQRSSTPVESSKGSSYLNDNGNAGGRNSAPSNGVKTRVLDSVTQRVSSPLRNVLSQTSASPPHDYQVSALPASPRSVVRPASAHVVFNQTTFNDPSPSDRASRTASQRSSWSTQSSDTVKSPSAPNRHHGGAAAAAEIMGNASTGGSPATPPNLGAGYRDFDRESVHFQVANSPASHNMSTPTLNIIQDLSPAVQNRSSHQESDISPGDVLSIVNLSPARGGAREQHRPPSSSQSRQLTQQQLNRMSADNGETALRSSRHLNDSASSIVSDVTVTRVKSAHSVNTGLSDPSAQATLPPARANGSKGSANGSFNSRNSQRPSSVAINCNRYLVDWYESKSSPIKAIFGRHAKPLRAIFYALDNTNQRDQFMDRGVLSRSNPVCETVVLDQNILMRRPQAPLAVDAQTVLGKYRIHDGSLEILYSSGPRPRTWSTLVPLRVSFPRAYIEFLYLGHLIRVFEPKRAGIWNAKGKVEARVYLQNLPAPAHANTGRNSQEFDFLENGEEGVHYRVLMRHAFADGHIRPSSGPSERSIQTAYLITYTDAIQAISQCNPRQSSLILFADGQERKVPPEQFSQSLGEVSIETVLSFYVAIIQEHVRLRCNRFRLGLMFFTALFMLMVTVLSCVLTINNKPSPAPSAS